MEGEDTGEDGRTYNTELISVIYNTELKEHLNQLKNNLSEVTNIFREGAKDLSNEEKTEKVQEMKEYIEQALASLAYSTTHATQKIDDGLKMQVEKVQEMKEYIEQALASLA